MFSNSKLKAIVSTFLTTVNLKEAFFRELPSRAVLTFTKFSDSGNKILTFNEYSVGRKYRLVPPFVGMISGRCF
jgi:hypothetical protein